MPTASDLCNLYNKETYISEFIATTILAVERSARYGTTYEIVDVPSCLTRNDIEIPLRNAFPDCKISWKWFIQSYKIKWA